MTRMNAAIIGCGWVSDSHVRDGLHANPDLFSLIACCDTDSARVQHFGDQHEIDRRVTDAAEVMAMRDIDVVVICTPPSSHFVLMQAALSAGKHVICEKPLTSSLALVDRVVEMERRSTGRVMPIFQYRFGNGIARARHVIRSGLAGRAYVASVETAKRRTSAYYDEAAWRGRFATELGGVLLTQAIHIHDLLLWLLGPVAAVSAFKTTRVNPIEVEDCAVASLLMADGSLASLAATLGSARQLARLRLCFENLTIQCEAYDAASATPGEAEWTIIPSNHELAEAIAAKADEVSPAKSGFTRQYELFHQTVASGDPMPVTLEDARRSLELITAIFDAAETGHLVTLPIAADHPRYRGWHVPVASDAAA